MCPCYCLSLCLIQLCCFHPLWLNTFVLEAKSAAGFAHSSKCHGSEDVWDLFEGLAIYEPRCHMTYACLRRSRLRVQMINMHF